MRKLFGIILLIAICFFVCGQKAKASDPLQDCLDEVNEEYTIEFNNCILAFPGSYACVAAATDRLGEGIHNCHAQYDN